MSLESIEKSDKQAVVIKYCQTKDGVLRDQIVELYSPLVHYISRKLAFNKDDVDDLFQIGCIGLIRALDRFDITKEVDFTTFATPNIIGEIKHYFRDKSKSIKIPRRLQEIHYKVKHYIREQHVQGISPTVQDIAEALELDEETVLEAMEAKINTSTISLDVPISSDSDPDSTTSLIDTVGVDSDEELHIDREFLAKAMESLSEREKKIIIYRFYKGYSQQEMAQLLNLSQMHISRLITKTLDKLKHAMKHAH